MNNKYFVDIMNKKINDLIVTICKKSKQITNIKNGRSTYLQRLCDNQQGCRGKRISIPFLFYRIP